MFHPGDTLYTRNLKPLEFRLEDIAIQVSQIENKRVVHPERSGKGTIVGYSIHHLNELYSSEAAAIQANLDRCEEKRRKLAGELKVLDKEIAELRKRLSGGENPKANPQ